MRWWSSQQQSWGRQVWPLWNCPALRSCTKTFVQRAQWSICMQAYSSRAHLGDCDPWNHQFWPNAFTTTTGREDFSLDEEVNDQTSRKVWWRLRTTRRKLACILFWGIGAAGCSSSKCICKIFVCCSSFILLEISRYSYFFSAFAAWNFWNFRLFKVKNESLINSSI